MDSIYSPASFQSENSVLHSNGSNILLPSSQQTPTPDTYTPTTSEEESTNNNCAHASRTHRDIEADRRHLERRHMNELSALVGNWFDIEPPNPSQLHVLQRANDVLEMINRRDQYQTLLPSYLTQDEVNFLNIEAGNAFLFVTTIEPLCFRVIHVSDSIYRILHLTPEQWLGQSLFSLIHPEDVLPVQNQLMHIIQHQELNKTVTMRCRLQQMNGSYSSVSIDGMIKNLNRISRSAASNEHGSFAFVGICHFPLTSQYNEINMSLYKDTQSLILSCRCLPNDWKVYLVDSSVSTFPSLSFEVFRNRSILEFIHPDDQLHVHQALLKSTGMLQDEFVTCRLMYSPTEIFTMGLKIKPFRRPRSQRTDFIELTFTHIASELEIN